MKTLDPNAVRVVAFVLCIFIMLTFWIGANYFRYYSFGPRDSIICDTWTGKAKMFSGNMF